jgi:midasin
LKSYWKFFFYQTAGEGKAINFYQDQNIGEAKKCVPVVLNVELRVKQLLDEWPSHPVLNEISLISERLLGFALTEPLAKLLMALELILDKCQHWEAKAHSGVSLQPQMEVLGNLIVEWRKLELSQWQSALDQVVRQKAEKATKWWLLLFSTVMETVADQAPANALASLITVIQRFVESSTLGEYRVRLALLQTMGLHFSASRTVSGNSSKRGQGKFLQRIPFKFSFEF